MGRVENLGCSLVEPGSRPLPLLSSVTAVTGPTLVPPFLGWHFLAVALVLSPIEWQVNYIKLNNHSGRSFHELWESL